MSEVPLKNLIEITRIMESRLEKEIKGMRIYSDETIDPLYQLGEEMQIKIPIDY